MMKSVSFLIFAAILMAAINLAGCSSAATQAASPEEAINEIREKLGLPDTPLSYVDTTVMANSPDGDWQVSRYADSQGREFFVEVETNRVVEIDARIVLISVSPGAPALSLEELRAKAESLALAAVPGFAEMRDSLTYDEGAKGDNYFFEWMDMNTIGRLNRPFVQIGLHVSGELFAFYDTVREVRGGRR